MSSDSDEEEDERARERAWRRRVKDEVRAVERNTPRPKRDAGRASPGDQLDDAEARRLEEAQLLASLQSQV